MAPHVLLAVISNIATRNIIQLCHSYKMQLKMIVLVQKCSLILRTLNSDASLSPGHLQIS